MSIDFKGSDSITLLAAYIGSVELRKTTWEDIINRKHTDVQYNLDLINLTLAEPQVIKQSQHPKDKDTLLFHRPIKLYVVRPGCGVATSKYRYFRIVVNRVTKRIQTMFPTDKIQGGKELWRQK